MLDALDNRNVTISLNIVVNELTMNLSFALRYEQCIETRTNHEVIVHTTELIDERLLIVRCRY